MNYLSTFNEYDRAVGERDGIAHLVRPDDDELDQAAIWVVDLFPPSQYEALMRQLRKNNWDRGGVIDGFRDSNAETIERARLRQGFLWTSLGRVVPRKSSEIGMDLTREDMPPEFSSIAISAIQIGSSLTAIVALFRLSEVGRQSVNLLWQTEQQPRLLWHGAFRKPRVLDRYFSGLTAPQAERQRIHDQARTWLSSKCAGFFSQTHLKQPVIDLNIFKRFDPETMLGEYKPDAYRALGFHNLAPPARILVSADAPGLTFIPSNDDISSKSDVLKNCWGAVGTCDRLMALHRRETGGHSPWDSYTLARELNEKIRTFLIYQAALQYQDELERTYATSRDMARRKHGKFSPEKVKQLRAELLSTSLDLAVVARDIRKLWDAPWRSFIPFTLTYTSLGKSPFVNSGSTVDIVSVWGERHQERMRDLLREDAAYRDVLVTVASLGTSAETSKLGRAALGVSFVSLVVAAATLLLASTGKETLWGSFLAWLGF